jgi:hypothetical protein
MVTSAILQVYDLVKLHFNMQAVQITQSSGPVHQGGKYSMLIGCVMVVVEARVQAEVDVGGFPVHFMDQYNM